MRRDEGSLGYQNWNIDMKTRHSGLAVPSRSICHIWPCLPYWFVCCAASVQMKNLLPIEWRGKDTFGREKILFSAKSQNSWMCRPGGVRSIHRVDARMRREARKVWNGRKCEVALKNVATFLKVKSSPHWLVARNFKTYARIQMLMSGNMLNWTQANNLVSIILYIFIINVFHFVTDHPDFLIGLKEIVRLVQKSGGIKLRSF